MSDVYKIFVTNVINPDKFFAQIGTEESFQEFIHLEDRCTDHAESISALRQIGAPGVDLPDINVLEQGLWVLAYSSLLKRWRRARINMVSDDEIDVNFVDYEFTEMVAVDNIITSVPDWVYQVKPIVFKCKLAGIRPIAKTYINRASQCLTALVQSKLLDVRVLVNQEEVLKPPFPVDILVRDPEKGILLSVGDLLKEEGLAMEQKLDTASVQGGPRTKGPYQVPDFDVNQLLKKENKKEGSPSTVEVTTDNVEQSIFTKGLGQRYKQHQDLKIKPLPDPGDSPVSDTKYLFDNITQQLSEMRNANTKADRNKSDQQSTRSCSSPGSSKYSPVNTRQRASPRPGLGRGAPPPHQITETTVGETQQASNPSLGREKSPPLTKLGSQLKVSIGRGTPPPYKDSTPLSGETSKEDSSSTTTTAVTTTTTTGGGGPAPRFFKQRNSPKNHAQRLALRRNSTPDPDKVHNLTEKQKKTEYEWQSDQFCFKVKEMLQRAKDDDLQSAISAMKNLVYPASSRFENLPGKKELFLCIKTVAIKTIEEHEKFAKIGPALIQELKDDPDFNCNLSEMLWGLQGQFVRVVTSKVGKQHIENYCNLLEELFVLAKDWEDNTTINTVVVNTLDKWTMFNKKLFAECLQYLLRGIGKDLDQRLPSETQKLFNEIQDRLTCKDIPSYTRDSFQALLEMRMSWQKEEEGEAMGLSSTSGEGDKRLPVTSQQEGIQINDNMMMMKGSSILVVELDTQDRTTSSTKDSVQQSSNIQGTSCEVTGAREAYTADGSVTQKEVSSVISEQRVETNGYRDMGCQVEVKHLIPVLVEKAVQTEPEYPQPCANCCNLSRMKADRFERVCEMLRDLYIEEFLKKFQEMGIRDLVLDQDFCELQELLQKCGLKPGQVLEIKTYLKKKSESSSSASDNCDTVDHIVPLSHNAEALFARIEGSKIHNDLSRGNTQNTDTQSTSDDKNLSNVGKVEKLSTVEIQSQPWTSTQNWVSQSQNIYTRNSDITKVTEKTLISPQDFELSAVYSVARQPKFAEHQYNTTSAVDRTSVHGNLRKQLDTDMSQYYDSEERISQHIQGNMVNASTAEIGHSPPQRVHPAQRYDFSEMQTLCKDGISEHNSPPGNSSGDSAQDTCTYLKHQAKTVLHGQDTGYPGNMVESASHYTNQPSYQSVSANGNIGMQHRSPTGDVNELSNYDKLGKTNNSITGKSISPCEMGDSSFSRMMTSPKPKVKIGQPSDSGSGEITAETVVVSPSSYLPPSPQDASPFIINAVGGGGGASLASFPTLTKSQERTKAMSDTRRALADAFDDRDRERPLLNEGEEKGPVLSPLSQCITGFGQQQQPMCSLCGERGTHSSYDCPEKMNKLFL